MNSSRASLLVIFSLILACFTNIAQCDFENGDVFAISVYQDGGLIAPASTITISEGHGDYSTAGVQVTLADNTLTFAVGTVADKDFTVQLTKTSGSASIFNTITVVGTSFDSDAEAEAVVSSAASVSITFNNVDCVVACDATVLLTFLDIPAITVSSVSPKQIHPVGGSITISGQGFNFTTPTRVTVSKGAHSAECEVEEVSSTQIVCNAPEGVSKPYNLVVHVGPAVSPSFTIAYGEPFITGANADQIADWAAFVHIRGGNFNPNNVFVQLTQGSQKKRSLTHPVCQIVAATTTTITCSVVGLTNGPLSAVASTNGFTPSAAPKAIGKVVPANTYLSTSAATCVPPSGTPDLYQNDMCNCWSGYAPSESDAPTDCNVHAKCAQRLTSDQDYFGSDVPQQPVSTFKDDTLTITQHVGIVQNRRSSFIKFHVPKLNHTLPALAPGTEGALTCNYPGVLWSKTVDTLDCEEVYTAHMPWSQNQFCGFVQDLDASNQQTAVYKAVLSTSYIEVFPIEGVLTQRLSSYSYQVHVSFKTQKAISSANINVFLADPSATGFVQVSVVADAVYDAASGNVLVSFVTTAAWPYQLDITSPTFVNSVPVYSGLSVDIANMEFYSGTCDTTQDSNCQQKWYVRIANGGNCDIAGVYTFSDALVCRDVATGEDAGPCPDSPAPVQFSVRIKTTDLCDPTHALDATEQMTTDLSSFFDNQYTTPTDTFQTGDMIYWRFTIKNPQGSIDKMTFEQILIDIDGGDSDILLETTNITAVGAAVQLATTNVDSIVHAGDSATLTFSHKLLRSALTNTVGTLSAADPLSPDNTVALKINVVVDIWYHGNQKRSVYMSAEATQAASSHSIRVVNNGADEAFNQEVVSSFSFLGSSSAISTHSTTNIAVLSLLVIALVSLFL